MKREAFTATNSTRVIAQQIYDSGWVRITINGIASQVNYGHFDTQTGITTSLASTINSSGANVYVTASVVSGTIISLQAKNAGAAGNGITLSATSASNDPGDLGNGSFGGTASGSTLTGGAAAIASSFSYNKRPAAADHVGCDGQPDRVFDRI